MRDLGVRGEAARGETELLAKVVEAVVEEEVEPDCVGVVQVGLGGEAVGGGKPSRDTSPSVSFSRRDRKSVV